MKRFLILAISAAIIVISKGLDDRKDNRSNEDFEEQTNDEKRLLDYLMRNYNNKIRPVVNAKSVVTINLGITLTQIFDLDEKNQVLTTNVWLDQEWKDEFLKWNKSDFGNLTKIKIPCDLIWLPDIVFADEYTDGYMQSRAMVHPDGTVFWPPPIKLSSSCQTDVTYFPFDDQICELDFASWIYDGFQVDLTNFVQNGEWTLMKATIARELKHYPCCVEPFPHVKVTIIIRRKVLYYFYNIIVPCLMLSVLTLFVFYLPPDSGEKVSLGVTILLAFSVFMLVISEKLPETSDSIPLLGLYLTTVMIITSISVIMTVFVLNFHYRGPVKKQIPKWICKYILQRTNPAKRNKEQFENSVHLSQNVVSPGTLPLDEILRKFEPLIGSSEFNFITEDANGSEPSKYIRRNSYFEAIENAIDEHMNAFHESEEHSYSEELLHILRKIQLRQEMEEKHNKSVNEWRLLALLIDKILFWIFLLITSISSLVFLFVVPITRR